MITVVQSSYDDRGGLNNVSSSYILQFYVTRISYQSKSQQPLNTKIRLVKPFRSNPFKESAASRLNGCYHRDRQSIFPKHFGRISRKYKLPCELAPILHNDSGMI